MVRRSTSAGGAADRRKEPLTDASHVRNAIARFDQVTGVSDEDRALAFANIKKAAEHYSIDMTEMDWTQLGKNSPYRPNGGGPQSICTQGGSHS